MITKRLWYYFRIGHGTYLAFSLQMINTILLVYNFALKEFIPDIYMMSILLFAVYVPIAVLIGKYHINNQFKTEFTIQNEQNPLLNNINRKLDLLLGEKNNEHQI